jgi:hypothetical protein
LTQVDEAPELVVQLLGEQPLGEQVRFELMGTFFFDFENK